MNVGNKRNPAAVSNWASHTQTTVQGKEKVLETLKNDLLSRFHNIFLHLVQATTLSMCCSSPLSVHPPPVSSDSHCLPSS
jgi:hypothetical protein